MDPVTPDTSVLAFGEFELDPRHLELRRGGERVEIQPTPLRVLAYLAQRRDRMVQKDELLDSLWEGAHVTDASLANALKQAREAVGDDGTAQRVIRTFKGHGYRFVAQVEHLPTASTRRGGPHARRPEQAWVAVVAALAVLAGLIAWWQHRSTSVPSTDPIRSLAVLPLENLSGDPDQEYFADGMTEALIGNFAKIGSLRVISRTSVMRYKDQPKAVPEIARELGVDGIVEGSVMRVGDRIRITAQLVDARTDSNLWSDSYDRDAADVLALLSDVARAVVEEVRVELSPNERAALITSRPVDPRAYDLYLRGLRLLGPMATVGAWSPGAIDRFEEAVELDPKFAEAWAWLGVVRFILGTRGSPPSQELLARARVAAEKALEVDDRLGIAHTVLAAVRWMHDWDVASARALYERALQLSPNDTYALMMYARYLLEGEGRMQEALSLSTRAVTLAPFDPLLRAERARFFFFARRFERALEEFEAVRELRGGFYTIEEAETYHMLGRFEECREVLTALFLQCGAPCEWQHRALERGWADGGWEGSLRAWLDAARERDDVPSVDLANFSTLIGETDHALDWLERAYRERDPVMTHAPKSHPEMDPLRTDPRFDALLRRIGLEKITGDPGVLAETGRALAFRGQAVEATGYLEEAMELAPEDSRLARWLYGVGVAHFAEERYETAADWALRALEQSASEYTTADANLLLAASYGHLGRPWPAHSALGEALRTWPEFRVDVAPLPAYADQGLRERYVAGLHLAGLGPQAGP